MLGVAYVYHDLYEYRRLCDEGRHHEQEATIRAFAARRRIEIIDAFAEVSLQDSRSLLHLASEVARQHQATLLISSMDRLPQYAISRFARITSADVPRLVFDNVPATVPAFRQDDAEEEIAMNVQYQLGDDGKIQRIIAADGSVLHDLREDRQDGTGRSYREDADAAPKPIGSRADLQLRLDSADGGKIRSSAELRQRLHLPPTHGAAHGTPPAPVPRPTTLPARPMREDAASMAGPIRSAAQLRSRMGLSQPRTAFGGR